MLTANAGRVLTVWSGVAVRVGATVHARVVGSFVSVAPLSDAQVRAYVATGEPFGAAGGFRIQGRGADLVTAHRGCWTNIVGLPTCAASRLLVAHGVALAPDGCSRQTDVAS